MNCFNGYTKPVIGGHLAMLRFAEDGQAEPVLNKGGKAHVFPTELEAQKAVTAHLLAYINGHYRRSGPVAENPHAVAESFFKKGKKIAVESVKKPARKLEDARCRSGRFGGDRKQLSLASKPLCE